MPPKKPLKLKTTADLREDPKNPRAISPEALAGLKGSLSSFGDISGITLNSRTGELVSGHQRLKALTEQHGPLPIITLGAHTFIETPQGPVTIRLVDWPLSKQRAANIAANSPHISGEFTDELQSQLAALRADDAALFEALRFGELLFESAEEEPPSAGEADDVPQAPEKPKSKIGDIFVLGAHRLLCGDAMKPEEVQRLMDGKRADMVFTDPPYAIYGSSTGIAADIADDKMIRPFFLNVVNACVNNLKPFGHAFIFCDWRSWASWWEVSKGTGLTPKNMIVWDKGGGLGGMFANCHELMLFASHRPMRSKMTQKIAGERTVNGRNIWNFNRAGKEGEERVHNAQKPAALVQHAIELSTERGEIVLDFFGGSGTTLIAAEASGRACRMSEISPAYCDVIVARWENFTGKKAKLLS